MSAKFYLRLAAAGLIPALLGGCGSIAYKLPGHSAAAHLAPVTLRADTAQLALTTPARLPVPGGFWLGLASEDPAIVSVQTEIGSGGTSRVTLHAHQPGTTTVHYVNRFSDRGEAESEKERAELRKISRGAFQVTVLPRG